MTQIKNWILCIWLLMIFWNIVAAKNISLDNIVENITILYKADYSFEEKSECNKTLLENWNYLLNIWCLKKLNSSDNFTQNIDLIRDKIGTFDKEYDLEWEEINFDSSAKPMFDSPWVQKKYKVLDFIKNELQKPDLSALKINPNVKIELAPAELALFEMSNYSFYPVRRKLDLLWPCTLNNYWIAIASIDKKLVEANDDFHINRRIAFRWGYCTWWEDIARPFNAWVCWASSQVFRISLIHPFLETDDREPHSQRLTRYYWEKITWDDAAIIDFRKNLTLKNTSDAPIYFRYIDDEAGNSVLLVAISPKKNDKSVEIKKYQTGELSAFLSKDILSENQCKSSQSRISEYESKSDYITE